MGKDQGLETLEVWKSAKAVRREVAILTRRFPKNEQYSLTDQVTRSSRSISANIAEGYGRFHYKDSVRFCCIARGSLLETLDHLYEARECSYISQTEFENCRPVIDRCNQLINGYIRYLSRWGDKS